MNPWMDAGEAPSIPSGHDPLAHDLALWLSCPRRNSPGFVTWENIEFPDTGGRPDVYAITATLNPKRWSPVTYEVKVSVGDFHSDVNAGKWGKYQQFSAYVVFAVSERLAPQIDIPEGCGLIVRTANGWVWNKRGRRNGGWKLTERQWMNLCLKGRNPSPYEHWNRPKESR